MFDPKHDFDKRLAAEMGIYGDGEFLPVPEGSETELKFLTDPHSPSDFAKIRNAISAKNNRVLDPRTIEIKQKVLITLNIDTFDQKLRNAGLSARVRFEFDPYNPDEPLKQIDISVKTLLSNDTVIYMGVGRGEWEAELRNLTPNLFEIVKQNKGKLKPGDKPIPDIIKSNTIKPNMLFVKSVGFSWRGSYISTHLVMPQRAAVYAHTEDFNGFDTPFCDRATQFIDREAEAELQGFMGKNVLAMKQQDFQRLTQTSLRKTRTLIEGASSTITFNRLTKSVRADNAVKYSYQELSESGYGSKFKEAANSSAAFALSQRVKTTDVRLGNLCAQLIRMRHVIDKNLPKEAYESSNFG